MSENKILDLIILGTGPAGLAASVYASRYKINHSIIGSEIGGYLNEIHKVENYPGFESISGLELGKKMASHAKYFGAEIRQEIIEDIKKLNDHFEIKTNNGFHRTKFLLYSIGTSARRLGIPGEDEFKGRGVSYCATCDGPFFKDKQVVVVGGANSAAVATLMIAEHAKKVTMFYRGEKPRCTPTYLEQMQRNPKIEIICCTNLKEIKGKNKVESIILDKPYNKKNEFETDGVFIEIGSNPNNSLIMSLGVKTDQRGYIKTETDQSTSLEGFYAAGDITTNSNGFRQIVTATAEGAIAVYSIYEKINS
jgi:thioredoxin reductase (NADPH)